VCAQCRAALPWLRGAVCERCALPLPCGPPCPARGAAFERSWSPMVFDGSARALVHALKFSGRTAVAGVMAAQMVANAPKELLSGEVALVPAPTHPQRRRRRGFDQAELLARAMGRRAGLPVLAALERAGSPATQMGAGRGQRRRGVVVRARREVPARVVVVDDVHTTGATLDACARALRGAGAREVAAVAYARTLP